MAQKKRVYGTLENVRTEEQYPIYDEASAVFAKLKLTDVKNKDNIKLERKALLPEESNDCEIVEFDRLSFKFIAPEIIKVKGNSAKWNNASAFAERIEEYFTICEESFQAMKETGKNDDWIIPTINGLALHLGMTRDTLLHYEKMQHDTSDKTPEEQREMLNISDSIKKAKATIEANEEQLATKGKINPILAIWREKTRFGYEEKSKQTIIHEGGDKPIKVANLTGDQLDDALKSVLNQE